MRAVCSWLGRAFSGLALLWAFFAAQPAAANPLEPGWALVPEASTLRFQSVKNVSIIESSSIAQLSGQIAADGRATVEIALDSVDTGIDLRNVRMRFLFFETYEHPVATVSLRIDPDALSDLAVVRRLPVRVDYTLDLHGVTRDLSADVVVTLIADGLVSVSSTTPIPITAADFDLSEGVRKLEDAAKVTITPAGSVSFDFIFKRSGPSPADLAVAEVAPQDPSRPRQTTAAAPEIAALDAPRAQEPRSSLASQPRAALEPDALDMTACETRFEALSQTGAVYFAPGSARLDPASAPLLTTVADIVARCPGLRIVVAGHTDSIGSSRLNLQLSERRARAVANWLVAAGIAERRISALGYGEERPVAPNDTRRNRALNRRIEFSVFVEG
ncbi:MAG: OmpA family protein [Pseudomonadota bacterium]